MEHLKGEDWDELRERYPGAYHFLLHRELKNEAEALRALIKMVGIDPRRRKWSVARLEALERLEL